MSVDVSKYLHFALGGKPSPDWDRMLDMRQIPAFLAVLKNMQIDPDGILQKLDTFSHAIPSTCPVSINHTGKYTGKGPVERPYFELFQL